MKHIYRIVCLFICILTVQTGLCSCNSGRADAVLHLEDDKGYIPCASQMMQIDGLKSGQAFVYDVENKQFIYRKGEEKVVYPASTTKLLTIVCALELLDTDEIVTPGNELDLVPEDSSLAYIKSYHALTVEMLIEGMLLPSGNDAAYALAAAAGKKLVDSTAGTDGKGAVRIFMDYMNSYAEKIGMCGSHFASPDGYYSDQTYTTVEDIAIISVIASQNKIIRKYSKLICDNVTYASGHTNTWTNTNLLLDPDGKFYSPYVSGLKTGSAGAGNYSLISTAELENRQYIIGVFSSPGPSERYEDTLNIIGCIMQSLHGA